MFSKQEEMIIFNTANILKKKLINLMNLDDLEMRIKANKVLQKRYF
jgi:hypothetical protein